MKILLIDDHSIFREGLALLLNTFRTGIEILQAGTCEEAFGILDSAGSSVDIAIMDLTLPGMQGLDGIPIIRERHPETPIVVLSANDDMETIRKAIDQGAMGFIPKSSNSKVMICALNLVLEKGIYLPPCIFLTSKRITLPNPPPAVSGDAINQLGLTPRQREVLFLLLQGKPAKAICRDLDLSLNTVKSHTTAVLRALNVSNRTEAVIAAGKLGLRFG